MNVVLIITDTQNKSMLGAYGGNPRLTPNLTRLSAEGITFENCYTASPLCTPARGAIFSGMYPQVNGAICNNMSPGSNIPLMGTIMRRCGYRAGYTGKWHLDGAGYFGDGEPGGGFEPDWWYDGKRYAEDLGPQLFKGYRNARTPDDLRSAGFTREMLWGTRVADRAVDFLETVNDPFVLVCSFDEPHEPSVAPPEYWESIRAEEVHHPPNYNASVRDKPSLAQLQRAENGEDTWQHYASSRSILNWYACNSYIDGEIGRVIDTVKRLHDDNTLIIYTADHGDQHRAHGLISKGPMMYEESTNVPFIVRPPALQPPQRGRSVGALVSHLDILPTILDYASAECSERLHGTSLRGLIEENTGAVHDAIMISFHRFAINHDSFGAYYPIRCATDGRYKLVINLHDRDEFYDLERDPFETENAIESEKIRVERDRLHDWLLAEMDTFRDPYRGWVWANRSWRTCATPFFRGGANRPRPAGFSFEPSGIEA